MTPGRIFRPKVTADYIPPIPLPAADDTAALRCENARLRAEIAMHQRSVALWREIAESAHGQLSVRVVHLEHKCSILRFLLFSAWVKLGEAAKRS